MTILALETGGALATVAMSGGAQRTAHATVVADALRLLKRAEIKSGVVNNVISAVGAL